MSGGRVPLQHQWISAEVTCAAVQSDRMIGRAHRAICTSAVFARLKPCSYATRRTRFGGGGRVRATATLIGISVDGRSRGMLTLE
jgi:hypothetical protein